VTTTVSGVAAASMDAQKRIRTAIDVFRMRTMYDAIGIAASPFLRI
jgi:hypothetical protein